MAFLDFLFGKKEPAKTEKIPTMTPEQMNLLNMILGQAQGPLQQGFSNLGQILSGDQQAFQAFEQPYMRQFNEQILPSIAERFSAVGAQGSSAFPRAMGQAAAGLTENLAAMREGLKQNALSSLMGMINPALGARTFEPIYSPERQNYGLLGSLLPGIGAGAGSFLGALPSQMYLSSMLKQFMPKPATM